MANITPTPASIAEARFLAFREFSFRFASLAGFLPLLILLRDLVLHRDLALGTLTLRFAVMLLILAYPWALRLEAPRRLLPWILYGSVATVEVLIIQGLTSRPQSASLFQGAAIYLFILTPILGLPFSLRANLLGLGALLLAPTPLVLLSMGGSFSLLGFHLMVLPACLIMGVLQVLTGRMSEANHRYRLEIEFLALRDALTGLHNRRHFMQAGELALKQAHRGGHPACLLILDIDHFKAVNDTHGHGAGDQVIRAAGQGLQATLRETDLVARIGGEEFAAFLPETPLEAGMTAAERIRTHLASLEVPADPPSSPLRFTVSLGLVELRKEDSLGSLLERADHGLYAAKRGGRNRVVVGA